MEERHPIKSDGGSTSYYEIPEGASELNDLIEYKNMNFAQGNIFKACYRLGEKDGTDIIYDLKKIIFFANRLIKMEEKKAKNNNLHFGKPKLLTETQANNQFESLYIKDTPYANTMSCIDDNGYRVIHASNTEFTTTVVPLNVVSDGFSEPVWYIDNNRVTEETIKEINSRKIKV